ncbi:alkylhydroperoxidase [Mycolicibacterium smegmatis]|nr:alkylhydroperoxidase [Mycolicibacterium smegmatis]
MAGDAGHQRVEMAALHITEYVTNISTAILPDAIRTEINYALSPRQIAAVQWVVIVINAFTRVAICSRIPVPDRSEFLHARGLSSLYNCRAAAR